MTHAFLMEREIINPNQAARVIDFLAKEGLEFHDSYALIAVPSSDKNVELALKRALSTRLGVALNEFMPGGVYGKILKKFDPLRSDDGSASVSCKTWINFAGIAGGEIIKVGVKSALARFTKLQIGGSDLDFLAEFATMRSPSFLPGEVPQKYSLHVRDVFKDPKLKDLPPACGVEVRQYLTELVEQLRII